MPEMTAQFQKSRGCYVALGLFLAVTLTAVVRAETLPDMTQFAIAKLLPESSDAERAEKFKSFNYLGFHGGKREESLRVIALDEMLKLARTMENPDVQAHFLLKIAREYSDGLQDWEKYSEITGELDAPYQEMGRAYRAAFEEMQAGNKDATRETLWKFVPPPQGNPYTLQQAFCGEFCFITLGKLGLTEEAVDYLKNVIRMNRGDVEFPDGMDGRLTRSFGNSLTDAIFEVGVFLVNRGERRLAFDFALDLYDVNANSGNLMNLAIEKTTEDGELDTALELTRKIEAKLGRQTQWETYPIFQALLKTGEQENYEKALQLTREVQSFNGMVQKQMYFRLMESLLSKNEKDQCEKLLDEAIQKSAEENPGERLRYFHRYAQIAKSLENTGQLQGVVDTAKRLLDAILNPDGSAKQDVWSERSKVHSLCEFAEVLFAADHVEECREVLQKAIEQTKNVSDSRQADWALAGVAGTQAKMGWSGEAFATAQLILDRSVETEAYSSIGLDFLQNDDRENAEHALSKAEEGLSQINDSRIFGLVNFLRNRLEQQ